VGTPITDVRFVGRGEELAAAYAAAAGERASLVVVGRRRRGQDPAAGRVHRRARRGRAARRLPALGATGLPFSPVVEVLRALTGEGGSTAGRTVVLVLEDLHWADRSTRQLLGFVAHNLRDQRLLVVAAYRAAGGRGRRC
jgi:AAA ATPase domain